MEKQIVMTSQLDTAKYEFAGKPGGLIFRARVRGGSTITRPAPDSAPGICSV